MCDSPLNGTLTRNPGAMEPLYWSPGSPIFECTMDDARTLPQRVVWFGSTSGCPREVSLTQPQPSSTSNPNTNPNLRP